MKMLESRFWQRAAVLFAIVALLKGIRVPGSWALSQLQITYVCGFVKRGLPGQVLSIAHIRSAHAVAFVCLLELLTLVGLFALFTRQSGLLKHKGSAALVAAFAGSYSVTYLAHLVGYQDVALYAIALALVMIRRPSLRLVIAVPVCVLAVMIHENFLLSAFPVVIFSFMAERHIVTSRGTVFAGILLVCIVTATEAIALSGTLSPAKLERFKQVSIARSKYTVDPRSLDVVGTSVRSNLKLNYRVIRQNWWWWAESLVALMTVGPLVALIVYRASSMAHGLRWAIFLITSFMPLSLNLFGWDSVRWAALCTLTAYINLGLLKRSASPAEHKASTLHETHAAILVMGLGLASGHGLMDSAKINPFPFFPPAIRPAVIRHDGQLGQVL